MTIYEMLNDDDEGIRAFANACIENALEEQIKENKGKTINEIEAQEIIDDILGGKNVYKSRADKKKG